jgi:hypothetical protein
VTDVMILVIFSPKKTLQKIGDFFEITHLGSKIGFWFWFSRKTPILSPKMAENGLR